MIAPLYCAEDRGTGLVVQAERCHPPGVLCKQFPPVCHQLSAWPGEVPVTACGGLCAARCHNALLCVTLTHERELEYPPIVLCWPALMYFLSRERGEMPSADMTSSPPTRLAAQHQSAQFGRMGQNTEPIPQMCCSTLQRVRSCAGVSLGRQAEQEVARAAGPTWSLTAVPGPGLPRWACCHCWEPIWSCKTRLHRITACSTHLGLYQIAHLSGWLSSVLLTKCAHSSD